MVLMWDYRPFWPDSKDPQMGWGPRIVENGWAGVTFSFYSVPSFCSIYFFWSIYTAG